MCAGGLARDCYLGHVFWDMDTWMMPPVLALHDVAAGRLLGYRTARLAAARELARASGCNGTHFPWESAHTGARRRSCRAVADGSFAHVTLDSGKLSTSYNTVQYTARLGSEVCPVPVPYATQEIHISADVSLAVGQYQAATNDSLFLARGARELLEGVADFWYTLFSANLLYSAELPPFGKSCNKIVVMEQRGRLC